MDLEVALRSLCRHPGSTVAMVGILAVGIGVGTAVFSLLNEALLRPPGGVADPASLVVLERHVAERGIEGFTYRGFTEYRDRVRAFSGMAAARSAPLLMGPAGEVSPVAGMLVTEGYLPLLGVRLTDGRHFLPEEEVVGAPRVAMLSHRLWRERLGGDKGVVGAVIRLNGEPVTVVGVTAAGFEGLGVAEPVDVWLPLVNEELARPLFPVLGSDLFTSLRPIARLAPGVSPARAELELKAAAAEVEDVTGGSGVAARIVLSGSAGRAGAAWRRGVLSWSLPLTAAAALLLVLVVVNSGGILLARSVARRRETAVRVALGAGRWRLARQPVLEALVLAVPAAAGGLLLSRWVGTGIVRAVSGLQLALDHRVVLFVSVVALAACCLAALAPALAAARRDPGSDLRDQAGVSRPPRAWRALVSGQVALSLMLLTLAGLLVRGVRAEAGADVGFDTRRVYLAELDLRLAGHPLEQAVALRDRLMDEVATLPGVRAVAAAAAPPLDRGFLWGRWPAVPDGDESPIVVERNAVAPGYFDVLGTGIVAGRGFGAADRAGAPLVAVVNEVMAARMGPAPVLGRTVRFPTLAGPGQAIEIVGVTPGIHPGRRQGEQRPEVLMPLAQVEDRTFTLLFRVDGDARLALAAVHDLLRRAVPDLPPPRVESARARRDRMLSHDRLYARLSTLAGVVGLLVAGLGLYGMVAFDVAGRERELGVRLALGARHARVRATVVRKHAGLVAGGLALGAVGSILGGTVLARLVHGVPAVDAASLVGSTVALLLVAAAAAWLSTRRVAGADPATALRSQ
jgi:predicted permease